MVPAVYISRLEKCWQDRLQILASLRTKQLTGVMHGDEARMKRVSGIPASACTIALVCGDRGVDHFRLLEIKLVRLPDDKLDRCNIRVERMNVFRPESFLSNRAHPRPSVLLDKHGVWHDMNSHDIVV